MSNFARRDDCSNCPSFQVVYHSTRFANQIESTASMVPNLQIEGAAEEEAQLACPSAPQMPDAALDWPPEPLRFPETVGTLIFIKQTTDNKGSGVFALQDIAAGTDLLCEKPILRVTTVDRKAGKTAALLEKLSPDLQKAYFALHAFYRRSITTLCDAIMATNNFHAGCVEEGDEKNIYQAVFEVGSRFNHSCVPNTDYFWNAGMGMMIWRNEVDLKEGEEVTIDYGMRKDKMKEWYGFECACEACVPDKSSEELKSDASEEGTVDEDLDEQVRRSSLMVWYG